MIHSPKSVERRKASGAFARHERYKKLSCLICGSNNKQEEFCQVKDLEYATYKPVNYSMCGDCGFLTQEPMPSRKDIITFYPDEYRNYLPIDKGFFSFFKKSQFKNLAKKISNGIPTESNILEIGFGNGALLKTLCKIGFTNLYGIDFVSNNGSDLSSYGIKTHYQNAEEGISFNKTFDLIIMNNVIEHFTSPLKVLQNCREKLTKGGKVILLTPNSNAFEFMIFGKYWAGFHAPRHTYIFNNKNIKLVASQLGYSNVMVQPETDPGQWSISIQNMLQNNKLTKTKLKNGMSWYLLPLSLIVTPIAILQNVIGKSTSIMCTLKN